MATDRLAELRAIVRKRRSAVTAKENRIKRNTGVDIRGTSQDPRRAIDVVKRYNEPQLRKYLSDLNSFMSRNNGFVLGAAGSLLPKADWNRYKSLERQYNSIGARSFEEVADIFIPTSGMTIRQRDATIRPDSISAQGDTVNRPYSPMNRKSTNIRDAKALQTLIKSLQGKLSSDFLPAQIKEARRQLREMLTVIGNDELNKDAAGLTDQQFNILWNYTNAASNISGIYFIMQRQVSESSDSWYSSVVEDFTNDIRELFSWAKEINTEIKTNRRSSPRSSKTRRTKKGKA